MAGWMGKILRINLSRGSYEVESLEPAQAKEFIGGRGLAAKILYDEVDPSVDAFSPANKLIFAAGPLTGTGAISACTHTVVTKSPLTGAIACSPAAGYFGSEIKYAGYDAIVIEGESPEPVYLSLVGDSVDILPAGWLWGLTTHETEAHIKARIKDRWQARETHIASIGPAGEKLVRIASIISDKYWAAARSGVGAVMGAKNLKAIAVKGTEEIFLASGENYFQIISGIMEQVKAAPLAAKDLPELGTAFLVDIMNEYGILPARNFQSGVFTGVEKLNGQAIARTILSGKVACFSCPIACRRMTRISGFDSLNHGQGPDYETVAALGTCCGIDDLTAISRANYLCTSLGLDPISTGSTIACAMELAEKGLLSEKDSGTKLGFGDKNAMLDLVGRIAQRDGFGDVLAEGAYRLAAKYGRPELFIGVKGQEAPPYDPRGIQGMGLHYATANTGACHESGYMVSDELLQIRQEIDNRQTEGKAALVKLLQDFSAVIDSCGICYLAILGEIWMTEVFAMLEISTGAGFSERGLFSAGEKIYNLERLFNLRAGFGAKDDTLPLRLLEQPLPEGPAKGQVCQLYDMLPEYYKLRGWDDSGSPGVEKLAELGLDKYGVEVHSAENKDRPH